MPSSSSCGSSSVRAADVLLAAGVLAAAAIAAAAPRPFALEDMAAVRSITDLAIAPDGAQAVFTVRRTLLSDNRTQTDIWTVGRDGRGLRQLTDDGVAESRLKWSPDGTRVAFLADRDGSRQVWALSRQGGEAQKLSAHPQPVAAFDWSPDGTRLALVAAAEETADEKMRRTLQEDSYLLGEQWRNHRLWMLTPGDAAPVALTDGALHVTDVAWSPAGTRLALVVAPNAEADASEDAKLQILELDSRAMRDVPDATMGRRPAWSPDGRHLAFVRPFDGRGISREDVYVWEVASAGAPRNLSAPLDRDVEALFWTDDGRALDVQVSHGVTHTLARLDVARGAVVTRVSLDHTMGVAERTREGWVYVRSDVPPELVARRDDGGEVVLTNINRDAAQLQLPVAEAVRWKGPAGEVEGVVVKPPGFDGTRRYPLIAYPHGGPRGHSNLAFDAMVAYWASSGYVVLRPNFRGSTGYGDAFTRANVGDWGNGPFLDTMAGIDHLVAGGVADGGRLFMYGWSYGGIQANWAATHTERFRAIVSGAGVADFRLQYSISDARRWRFDYFHGTPFSAEHYPLYERESPVTHVGRAKTPTLFVHGIEDDRCPLPQGLMMYRALKDRGVTTELLLYPREGHGFTEPRHILDRARRVAEWFRRFDPAAGRTTSASF